MAFMFLLSTLFKKTILSALNYHIQGSIIAFGVSITNFRTLPTQNANSLLKILLPAHLAIAEKT
jgi:hypothetical protein